MPAAIARGLPVRTIVRQEVRLSVGFELIGLDEW